MFAALAVLMILLSRHGSSDEGRRELLVHCAAGLQLPLTEIARSYEREHHTRVILNFAGSGVLESQLKTTGGDLFIPADDSYIENAVSQGLVSETAALAELRAVIVVPKGNPKRIKSLSDIALENVRLCVAEPSAAVGKFTRDVLLKAGLWKGIEPYVIVTQPTVNGVVTAVATGSVDVGIAWDAVALQSPEVEIVRIPLFDANPRQVRVGVLNRAASHEARDFVDYLTAEEAGRRIFTRHHYTSPPRTDNKDGN
ncbi:hypothetical protein NT6N_36320 [Oceaniferula spumae]|uniref:Molybdate ABC transporter substrate-binding protein n=1 Tax=Oceaniferula spumae TaxID=2979115 RepID=A0AAT9FRH5_9BACT